MMSDPWRIPPLAALTRRAAPDVYRSSAPGPRRPDSQGPPETPDGSLRGPMFQDRDEIVTLRSRVTITALRRRWGGAKRPARSADMDFGPRRPTFGNEDERIGRAAAGPSCSSGLVRWPNG